MEENKYTIGEDDGSLAFLNIAPDPDNKFFNCDTVKQMALANRTFWVVDFMEDVPTKYSRDKERLHKAFRDFIEPYLSETLHVQVKDNWQVFPIASSRYDRHGRALDFVGYTFYLKHTGLRQRIKRHFAKRTAHYLRLGISGKRLRMKTASWTGWCKHADCELLKKTILKSA